MQVNCKNGQKYYKGMLGVQGNCKDRQRYYKEKQGAQGDAGYVKYAECVPVCKGMQGK